MQAITQAPRQLKLIGITLAVAALAATLLAVTLAAGQAQADGNTGNSGNSTSTSTDEYPNLSTYDDPQPCGPGAGDAFMEEPHKITSGHYALFDVYWRTIDRGEDDIDVSGVGVLHTNLCPPEMVASTTTMVATTTTQADPGNGEGGDDEGGSDEGGSDEEETVVMVRSARTGGMDVDEIIIHVLNTHLATTTLATSASDGQFSLAEYPDVADFVSADDTVWWLRLDDPDTSDVDETSDLGIGFSTLLLDDERWGSSMRYRIEVERHPTNPGDVPHFFAYEAPKPGNVAQAEPVWDSANPGEGVMELGPGEYRELQWVFTEPGTYLLWVHLLGDVKQPKSGDDWKPISGNNTETSEVYRYTFQVGDTLDETEPPIFGVNRSVGENSPGGVEVGDPIPVYNAEADVLYYELTGEEHSNFELLASTSTAPHSVQIVVADGANLDYEATSTPYELHLSVTDKVDHEHNFDPYADDVLIVRIDLEDQATSTVKLQADRTTLKAGETVKFFARFEPTSAQSEQKRVYQWGRKIGENLYHNIGDAPNAPTWSVRQEAQTTDTYVVSVELGDLPDLTILRSEEVEITWTNPN